jgi:hypothetical protein
MCSSMRTSSTLNIVLYLPKLTGMERKGAGWAIEISLGRSVATARMGGWHRR